MEVEGRPQTPLGAVSRGSGAYGRSEWPSMSPLTMAAGIKDTKNFSHLGKFMGNGQICKITV